MGGGVKAIPRTASAVKKRERGGDIGWKSKTEGGMGEGKRERGTEGEIEK